MERENARGLPRSRSPDGREFAPGVLATCEYKSRVHRKGREYGARVQAPTCGGRPAPGILRLLRNSSEREARVIKVRVGVVNVNTTDATAGAVLEVTHTPIHIHTHSML